MSIFWILVVIMLAIAILLVIKPLLRQTGISGPDAKDVNVLLYRQRVQELETDRDNGTLSDDQFLNAHRELEQQLLLDAVAGDANGGQLVDAKTSRWTALILALLLPAVSVPLYLKLGQWETLQSAHRPVATSADLSGAETSELPTMEEMITRLRDRLEQHPEDPAGWVMLGRSYTRIGRYQDAGLAFAEAMSRLQQRQEQPTPSLLLDYAYALAVANGEDYAGRPAAMINEALREEPDNPKGLWLAGLMNFQSGDHAKAIHNWTLLRAHVADGTEDAEILDAFIAKAADNMPEGIDTVQKSGGRPELAAANTDDQAATATSITVLVTLDSRLIGSAEAEDTVFVFARAVEGPPMPLAVVRKQVKDLPFKVTLDDSQAMMPALMLTKFSEVVIGARISRTGNATTQSGDLQGISDAIATNTDKPVSIVIDQVVP